MSINAEKLTAAGFKVYGNEARYNFDSREYENKQPTAATLAKLLGIAKENGVATLSIHRGEAGADLRLDEGKWETRLFPGGGHTVKNIQAACDMANLAKIDMRAPEMAAAAREIAVSAGENPGKPAVLSYDRATWKTTVKLGAADVTKAVATLAGNSKWDVARGSISLSKTEVTAVMKAVVAHSREQAKSKDMGR